MHKNEKIIYNINFCLENKTIEDKLNVCHCVQFQTHIQVCMQTQTLTQSHTHTQNIGTQSMRMVPATKNAFSDL